MKVWNDINNISIHPPLAGRDVIDLCNLVNSEISIHPPLAGRDLICDRTENIDEISIHPPLAGRDRKFARVIDTYRKFQSTRPSRDGTYYETRQDDAF